MKEKRVVPKVQAVGRGLGHQIRVAMKTLQTVTAVVEAGAGLALLGFPSATASLLLGMLLVSPAP
jgi:hypothetical protein